jgi:dihydrofolate reductase
MATIRGYIAASLDGYIASPDGGIDWLRQYDNVDMGEHGYPGFIAQITTVVMGRGTYDSLLTLGIPWPYSGKRTIVVTSRPITDPPAPIDVWTDRVDRLVDRLRALDDGDVWIVGGGKLQQAFIAAGALDQIELFVIPELIGRGIPLFPPMDFRQSVRLAKVAQLPASCVCLVYDLSGRT